MSMMGIFDQVSIIVNPVQAVIDYNKLHLQIWIVFYHFKIADTYIKTVTNR